MFKTVEALHDKTNRGFYPLTHEQAVIGNDEVDLETKLKNINNEISNINNEISNMDISHSKQYLTFTAIQDTTFTFSNALQYSLDDGTTWTTLSADTASPTVTAGNKIIWKQTGLTPTSDDGIGTFSATGNFNVSGNIMSLYYGDNFVGQIDLTGKNYAFVNLFCGCNKLVNAENLILPATTLAEDCYRSMFESSSLTTAPELPATTLANSCYSSMFYLCTSLTTAPELPATTLANSCYSSMFYGCTGLTKAPELHATTLIYYCYYGMFQGCTSLTKATELPATTLAEGCYHNMFYGCTSLTKAPELPATTLVSDCYISMFYGCTALNYIKCLATNISANSCTSNWVNNVSATGTFVKADSMTSWTTGNNGIPTGWTVYTESEWKEVKKYELDAAISNITHPVTSVNGQTGAVTITETQLSKGTTSGNGNAVTDINVSNHQITLVKGETYLTASDVQQMAAQLYTFDGEIEVVNGDWSNADQLDAGIYKVDIRTVSGIKGTGSRHGYSILIVTGINKRQLYIDCGQVGGVQVGGVYQNIKFRECNGGQWSDWTDMIPTNISVFNNDAGYITDAGVTSFNGATGAITYTPPVTSVNGQTGAVSLTIPSEVTESTVSGWGFTKNTGTLTSETQLSKGTATGAGNAVTDINVSNHQITLVKGATYATQNDIDTSIAALVNSAPATLDTLNELAAALGNDANFSTTVSTQIGNKISKVSNPTADNFASFNSDGTIKDSGHSHSDYITSIKTVNNESLVGSGNIVISGLPAVSSSDNGKILMVVNGQWQLVSPSVLYSGSGVPNNSNGNNGDIYIQTD